MTAASSDRPSINRERDPVRIGEWVLYPDRGVLVRDAESVRLMPKALGVLLLLLDADDRAVSREALLKGVWGASYPSDQVVSRAIADLRLAFGETAGEIRYIRTVPKFGYQLIAETEAVAPGSSSGAGAGNATDSGEPAAAALIVSAARRSSGWMALLVPALVLALGWWLWPERADRPVATPGLPDVRPLTSAPGLEHQPRWSPNGEWVVYASLNRASSDWNLHRVAWRTGETQPLAVESGVTEHGPAYSPDGTELAYVRLGQDGCDVVRQTLPLGEPVPVARCTTKFPTLVDWSPDGRWIAYTVEADGDAEQRRRIYRADLQRDQHQRVSQAVSATGSDFYPRYSPSGRFIAFLRGEPHPDHRARVWVADLESGDEAPLTAQPAPVGGMTWLDEDRVLVSLGDSGRMELKVIDRASGSDVAGVALPAGMVHPDLHPDSRRLVASQLRQDLDLAVVEADGTARTVARSTYEERHARFSPDGQWLAFVSDRTGFDEIWIAAVDDSAVRRLTRFDGARLGRLAWRPDGQSITFEVRGDGSETLFEVELLSGRVARIELPFDAVSNPGWLDQDVLIHGCQEDAFTGICFRDPNRSARLIEGLYRPTVSPDGVITAVDESGRLMGVDSRTATAETIWDGLPSTGRAAWCLNGRELLYLRTGDAGQSGAVVRRNLQSGRDTVVYRESMPVTDATLDVNAETGALVFSVFNASSDDLVIVAETGFDLARD